VNWPVVVFLPACFSFDLIIRPFSLKLPTVFGSSKNIKCHRTAEESRTIIQYASSDRMMVTLVMMMFQVMTIDCHQNTCQICGHWSLPSEHLSNMRSLEIAIRTPVKYVVTGDSFYISQPD
jgi:hypothetical protein